MTSNEYITVEQAERDLGQEGCFVFYRWLRKKGYNNMSQIGEAKYKHEIFATKDQLRQFIAETMGSFKGHDSTVNLYGQTREFLSKSQGRRRK